MKLNVKALAAAGALLWGGAVLLVSAFNLVHPPYGREFLSMVSSIYPGYHATASVRGLIVGTGYALVDGAIFGLVFGWLYNLAANRQSVRPPSRSVEKQKPITP